ncbi:MAG: ribose 5-phosphate isomerase B [Candidatus Woesearchaeota archaeon]|nr:ribose 5-phosphate isomerase B [Candidatus Woesearchaeota archaeon]
MAKRKGNAKKRKEIKKRNKRAAKQGKIKSQGKIRSKIHKSKGELKEFIVIGSDHAGLKLKRFVKFLLMRRGLNIVDVGVFSEKPADYPDIASKVALIVLAYKTRGILICKTGVGMCIAANRHKGIRAVNAYDTLTARMSREHNDSNVLCLRGEGIPNETIEKIVDVWLKTKFSNKKRHIRRIKKIDALCRNKK